MRQEDIAKVIGVSPATMAAKAKVIREGLDMERLDPDWCLPSKPTC
jgi:DNA-binding XRE family transcriptional regulator